MDGADRFSVLAHTHGAADAEGVVGRVTESDAGERPSGDILVECGIPVVLSDAKIGAAVAVEVPDGGTALLALKGDTALGRRQRTEAAFAIAKKAKAGARIDASAIQVEIEIILGEE